MKFNLKVYISLFLGIVFLSACTPDVVDINLYTSDVEDAAFEGEVIEVPVRASFSTYSDDEDDDLEKATIIAEKYLSPDPKFSQSSGDWGETLVIETTIPLGTLESLQSYLASNNRVAVLLVEVDEYENIDVSVRTTDFAAALDSELSDINFMLGFSLPADDTNFRVISDSRNDVEVSATAVFVSEKPYLYYEKILKKRGEAEIVFKGSSDSVYSEIYPFISIAPN